MGLVPEKPLQFESFWTRHSGWVTLAVVLIVFALGYLLDRLLSFGGMPRSAMLFVTNTVTGIVAGALFYQMMRHEKAQREIMRARMTTIADMNHHIRNALQVIKALGATSSQPNLGNEQVQLINQSVERVEWALREVLPKYPAGMGATETTAAGRRVDPRRPHAVL